MLKIEVDHITTNHQTRVAVVLGKITTLLGKSHYHLHLIDGRVVCAIKEKTPFKIYVEFEDK
jgi:hypothetical protein